MTTKEHAALVALVEQMKVIASDASDCQCDHDTEDCCANQPDCGPGSRFFCARCFASKSLTALLGDTSSQEPTR